MSRKPNIKTNQEGFASIVIALVLIVVLALLTIGFAQLARREQQTSLDKQLSTQAKYAAESGINAAYKDIVNKYITSDGAPNADGVATVKADSNNCMQSSADPSASTHISGAPSTSHPVNANTGVSYTCLLVNLKTKDLTTDDLTPGTGRHINFGTNTAVGSFTIHWGSATNRVNFLPNLDTSKPFTSASGWSFPPVIEFSLTPTSRLASQSNPSNYLESNTFNFFVYPSQGGSNQVAFDPSNQGQIIPGNCSGTGTYACSVTVNMPSSVSDTNFVVHYFDFYDTSNLQVTATPVPSAPAITFTGEPSIDVTGQARNVLKRLRARLLVNGGEDGTANDSAVLPNNAIEAQNLCKRIQAAPVTPDYSAGSAVDGTNVLDPTSCNVFQGPAD
jgi:Tfp pilus assembly protein PilX